MYYVDLKFSTEIRGISIETQSMNTAVQRVQDWINGYIYRKNPEAWDLPEINRIARTKSRGVEYVRLEDFG